MPKAAPIQFVAYKTKFPINTYLLFALVIIVAVSFLILKLNLYALAVYLPIAVIIFYIFFSRYSCKIEITNYFQLRVIYFFPWNKNITIDLQKFSYLDYARGFYSPLDNRKIGYLSLFRVCYDLLLLSDPIKIEQTEIKINTRLFSFKTTVKEIQLIAKLKLKKLESSRDIIW